MLIVLTLKFILILSKYLIWEYVLKKLAAKQQKTCMAIFSHAQDIWMWRKTSRENNLTMLYF